MQASTSKPIVQPNARAQVPASSAVPQIPRLRPIAQSSIAPTQPPSSQLIARPPIPTPSPPTARPLQPSQLVPVVPHNRVISNPLPQHVQLHSQSQHIHPIRPIALAQSSTASQTSSHLSIPPSLPQTTPLLASTSASALAPAPAPAASSAAIQTPPFLTKLFQLVEDPATKELVSWTDDQGLSFTVHKPSDFGRDVLPKYFKHNNFSSFVRQLNQYGFHKQNPDKWMFGHDNFRKNRPDLLRNITRRRPKQNAVPVTQAIVSPHTIAQNRAVVELGNYGLEGEVKSLKRDKDLLIKELVVTRQAEEKLKNKCDNLENRMQTLEHTTKQMQTFIMHYFSQVLQPYSEAVASRKRKRLPASTSAEDVMELVPENPPSDVATVTQVAQATNTHSIDSLRAMMQQMGVNMARNPTAQRARAPNQPLAIENGAFAPATVQELPEQATDEVVEPSGDVRVQSPPSDPENFNDSNVLMGPGVSLNFLDDLPQSPNSGLTMDVIESALKEPNGQSSETLHIDATPFTDGEEPRDIQSSSNANGTLDTNDMDMEPVRTTTATETETGTAARTTANGHGDECVSSKEDERAIEDFLELDDTPLPPPLTHLPEGTDIQALAQRIGNFAEQSGDNE